MNTLTKIIAILILATPLLSAKFLEDKKEYSFTLDPESSITIKAEDGDVIVNGADTDSISVSITRSVNAPTKEKCQETLDSKIVDVQESNNTVYIKSPKQLFNTNNKIKYRETITITAPYKTQLEIKTEDGDVNLSDIHSTVSLKAEDGSVHCTNFKGSITAKLDDGDLHCNDFAGTIEAKLEDGDAHIDLSGTPANACSIKSEDGDIHLTISDTCNLNINAKSSDGKIHTELSAQTLRIKDSENIAEFQINEGGVAINLKSNDGDIHIN